jgi:hypothetical protein
VIPSLRWRDDHRLIILSDVRLEGWQPEPKERNVPAGAVAEIRIINTDTDKETVGFMDPDQLLGAQSWINTLAKTRQVTRRVHK